MGPDGDRGDLPGLRMVVEVLAEVVGGVVVFTYQLYAPA
jgi:hypothetical protein